MKIFILISSLLLCPFIMASQGSGDSNKIENLIEATREEVILWRRYLHQNPELSNREFKTMEYIAAQLEIIGLPYEKGMAHTGVIALLETGKPGPVIGLRADIDGLPVKERTGLPFASKAEGEYLGEKVPVMHACGHDAHVAILLGVAKVLKNMKSDLTGKIVFIFQPAEEGAPPGEMGGAELLLKEGLFEKYPVDVIFGLHISSMIETGKIHYRPKGTMAAADRFTIKILGKQSHGSRPWDGIDPVTVAAQVVLGLQNIISRQTDIEQAPAVISVGKITGGVRNNIIPESVELVGTIRTLDTSMQKSIHEKIERTAINIAESAGAKATVEIVKQYPVTFNNPQLTAAMLPSLEKAAGEQHVVVMNPRMGAEDFSFYARQVPGLFFFLGARHPEIDAIDATLHHTPDFLIDENSFPLGIKSFVQLVIDYQKINPEK